MDCIAGSETGDKVANAMQICSDYFNSLESRNDEMCYSFNDTMTWLWDYYGYDMCVLGTMGWINEDGSGYNWDQWMTDIANLPEEVSGVSNLLSWPLFTFCIKSFVYKYSNNIYIFHF